MASSNGLHNGGHGVPQSPQQVVAAAGSSGAKKVVGGAAAVAAAHRSGTGYTEKALEKIRNSLRPFEQQDQFRRLQQQQQQHHDQDPRLQQLLNQGFDEQTARQLVHQLQNSELANGAAGTASKPGNSNNVASSIALGSGGGAPPALPPRKNGPGGTGQQPPPQPPRVPDHRHAVASANDGDGAPPPLPPPRQNANPPPPTPPRGTTPPPSSGHSSANPSHLVRRMSPVSMTSSARAGGSAVGAGHQPPPKAQQRGTSPTVAVGQPMRVPNSRDIQQQVREQLQNIFPGEDGSGVVEPPPPYPMGPDHAAAAAYSTPSSSPMPLQQPHQQNPPPPPPPSYSQTLAMRGSPTLSSTSSDYRTASSSVDFRRSPAPLQAANLQAANLLHHPAAAASYTPVMMGVGSSATPTSPVPLVTPASPASSMLSSSSSSMQAWSSRQAKTHSPIIMQSAKSTQVQKPVLQKATAVTPGPPEAGKVADVKQQQQQPPPPPPSYEFSIQQKQISSSPVVGGPAGGGGPPPHPSSPSAGSSHSSNSPVPNRVMVPVPSGAAGASQNLTVAAVTAAASVGGQQLPPPPPYPSSAVAAKKEGAAAADQGLVSGTQVTGKQLPVINTAKVVSNSNMVNKWHQQQDPAQQQQQRKFSSPLTTTVVQPNASEAGSSAASRSESPVSDSHTISASPDPEGLTRTASSATDSGLLSSMEMSLPPASLQQQSATAPSSFRTTHHTSPRPERRSLPPEREETRRESLIKYCSPDAFKFYMEQHIENVEKERAKRLQRKMQLERELAQLVEDPSTWDHLRQVLYKKETNFLRMKRAKVNRSHFKKIRKIGVGAFGEVSLVRSVDNKGLYAMKKLKKSQVVEQNQVAHVIAEKDILAEAENNWIVKLYYSFQDKEHLYFVMEYLPGGDLMNLLINEQIFSEEMARFYTAELVCAVESVHAMGFIHRDIKPDNILIDAEGHLKLTDFGLCTGFRWTHDSKYYSQDGKNGVRHCRQDSMDPGTLDLESGRCTCDAISSAGGVKLLERRRLKLQQRQEHAARCLAHSLVGTPMYMAPEVLERSKVGYTQACDWWSVGVIFYEMIVGCTPFYSGEGDPVSTQQKVIRWQDYLNIPPGHRMSSNARDLIYSMITSQDKRLGSRDGSSEIKKHPFFKNINFEVDMHFEQAPYKPNVRDHGLANFDTFEDVADDGGSLGGGGGATGDPKAVGDDGRRTSKDYIGFYEFTFRRFFDDTGHPLPLKLTPQQLQNQLQGTAVRGGDEATEGEQAGSASAGNPGAVYV